MSDENFFDRVNQSSQIWNGTERGPDQIVDDFHLYGNAKRAEALEQLDAELVKAGENGVVLGTNASREYARLGSLRRTLGGIHRELQRAGS